ncbi:unnamed protein product [Larinioides sclopetarius]|uniref:Uncharacterized protein n=1 Tax=Larinioides sclopetarius TaxID=280406 RepID=A0AAV1ZGY9_9ARAC
MQIGRASVRWRLVFERGSIKPKTRSAKNVGGVSPQGSDLNLTLRQLSIV